MRKPLRGSILKFDRRGRGAPLVLLHAFPLDRRMWDAAAADLSLDAETLAIDFRGMGESAPSAEPASVERAADDVAAVLDGLSIERAVVCGLSMGGYVALAFAERHAARLAGLAL